MPRFLITATALLAFGILVSAKDPAPATTEVPRLIQQLGSKRFKEREAATKALDNVGEQALEPLRKAAKDDADAEVRRRAGALVERLARRLAPVWAKRIIDSKLSRAERLAAMKALAKVGEPALDALRKAAKESPDEEVRRRAGQLVNSFDLRQRLGTWRIESIVLGGEVVERLPGSIDECIFTAHGVEGTLLFRKAGCQVDALATPQQITVVVKYRDFWADDVVLSRTYRGIYRVGEDEMVLCFEWLRTPRRPTRFKSEPGSHILLCRMRRQKPRP
jgi:hypothetical protein